MTRTTRTCPIPQRRARSLCAIVVGAMCGAVLTGCGGRELTVSPVRYDGPAIKVDAGDETYTFVMQAPTPGWTMEHVGTRQLFQRREVFVLIREPNPVFFYPQRVVDQHLGTDVRTDLPIDLHAAVVRHERSWPEGGFGFVRSDTGRTTDGLGSEGAVGTDAAGE